MSAEVERTLDGRYIVVHGRRWRASDPNIPENLVAELVSELMAARRAVGDARRSGHDPAVASARRRVSDAKHALGERGPAWWEPLTDAEVVVRCVAAARAVLRHRDETSSICPSDVAKIVHFASWRDVLPIVRRSMAQLAQDGDIEITRGDQAVVSFTGGPVRLRRGPTFPDAPPSPS